MQSLTKEILLPNSIVQFILDSVDAGVIASIAKITSGVNCAGFLRPIHSLPTNFDKGLGRNDLASVFKTAVLRAAEAISLAATAFTALAPTFLLHTANFTLTKAQNIPRLARWNFTDAIAEAADVAAPKRVRVRWVLET
jgi:hypothetical protein